MGFVLSHLFVWLWEGTFCEEIKYRTRYTVYELTAAVPLKVIKKWEAQRAVSKSTKMEECPISINAEEYLFAQILQTSSVSHMLHAGRAQQSLNRGCFPQWQSHGRFPQLYRCV